MFDAADLAKPRFNVETDLETLATQLKVFIDGLRVDVSDKSNLYQDMRQLLLPYQVY